MIISDQDSLLLKRATNIKKT